MGRADDLTASQVGDGAGDLEDTVEGAGREAQLLEGVVQELATCGIKDAVAAQILCLTFDGEALGTLTAALIFRLLSPDTSGEVDLVEQIRASWNSLLSWLREAQAWGQTA